MSMRIAVGIAAILFGCCLHSTAQDELSPEEVRRLVRQISQDMKSAEEIILQTGAGARDAQERAVAGLDQLATRAQDRQEAVLDGIDRLIEVARHQQQHASSECASCNKPGDGSSLTRRASPRREARRRDELQRTDQQKQPAEARREEARPEDAEDSPPEGRQQSGRRPPQSELGDSHTHPGEGPWGRLPDKVQEQIRTFDPDQYPHKDRRWLNDYLRRLNDSDG